MRTLLLIVSLSSLVLGFQPKPSDAVVEATSDLEHVTSTWMVSDSRGVIAWAGEQREITFTAIVSKGEAPVRVKVIDRKKVVATTEVTADNSVSNTSLCTRIEILSNGRASSGAFQYQE